MSAGARETPAPGAELVAWLDRRAEPAPASLRSRLAAAVVDATVPGDASLVAHSSLAGEQLLGRLLERGCGTRSEAPDLLAADALVTYAFEAAAEDPSLDPRMLDRQARDAMTRIAALGAEDRA